MISSRVRKWSKESDDSEKNMHLLMAGSRFALFFRENSPISFLSVMFLSKTMCFCCVFRCHLSSMQTIISHDDYSKRSQNKGKSGSKMEEFDCPPPLFFLAYFLLGVSGEQKYT